MNCTEVQENLPLFVLGELEASEMSRVNQHLGSGCPSCIAEWKSIQQTIGELYEVVPTAPLAVDRQDAIFADVETKIRNSTAVADSTSTIAVNIPPAPEATLNWRRNGLAYLLTCAGGLLVGMIVFSELNPQQNNRQPNSLPPWNSQTIPAIPSRVVLRSMNSSHADFEISATVVYDFTGGEIHFFGREMEQLPDGSRYVLWILDEQGQPLKSASLYVDDQGTSKAVLIGLENTRAHQGIVTIESDDGPLPLGETELSTAL